MDGPTPTKPIPKAKVNLNEVEETLKSMRQKRLSRLSTFVAEQSSLSEARRENKKFEEGDIEEAIISIQKSGVEKTKLTFKSIVEEIISDNSEPDGPKKELVEVPIDKPTNSQIYLAKNITRSSTKTTQKKKFINKFNCVISKNISSSNEDLSADDVWKSAPNTVEDTSKETPKNLQSAQVCDNISYTPEMPSTSHDLNSNYSRRKPIYLYESESFSLDVVPSATLTYETFGKTTPTSPVEKSKHFPYNNKTSDVLETNETKVKEQTNIPFKSLDTQASENNSPVYENIGIGKNETDEFKLKKEFKFGVNPNRKSTDMLKSPKSPLPVPRRHNQEEKVLRKLQRNWSSLNEILDNDSDVDEDEIDDLKNTLTEATKLLTDYGKKIKKLEDKVVLTVARVDQTIFLLKNQLEEAKSAVEKFRGLKRDMVYIELSNRLSSLFLEASKLTCIKAEQVKEKENVLAEVEKCVSRLESKIVKNEALLFEILSAQVETIINNRLLVKVESVNL